MRLHEAPFYLRRVKEALVTFPDPDTGKAMSLFTRRIVQTIEFKIDNEEWTFTMRSTATSKISRSGQPGREPGSRGALGFTMAMLQRRFASSTYALRRSWSVLRRSGRRSLRSRSYRQKQILRRSRRVRRAARRRKQGILDLLEEPSPPSIRNP